MSTGLHLQKETQDLIKNIGESRSKQDEDNLIKKDIEKLKKKIIEQPYEKMTNTRQIREVAIRAIYADMLGHDVSFVHFFLINMTNSKNLNVKRAGYLACWLLLGEDNDLRIMLVATLQRDLKSESAYDVLIALNSLNKLMNHSNINNLGDEVIRHLAHSNPLIRKKAYCLMQKMLRINPKSVPSWEMKLRDGLGDKEPSVMGVCLNIYYNDLAENPDRHKDVLKILVTIMNLILDVKLPRDYDFQRIPAPFLQIRILQIFGVVCQNDKKLSEEVYPTVEKAIRRADDTMTDVGFAVTFQAIKTITKLYTNQPLLEKASKTISKFFMTLPQSAKLNKINLYYMGIDSIRSLVNINTRYAAKHQVHIVDCLQHPDESIRRPTLDLLYKTTNTSNLEVIMDKLLHYLKSTNDERFKADLVSKIYELNERLAPNPDWFVRKTNIIFQYGEDCIDDNMLSRTVKIIEENLAMDESGEFGSLLLQHYYEFLDKQLPGQLLKLISWIFAEVGSRVYPDDSTSLNQLTSAIIGLNKQKTQSPSTKSWILSALAKLSACPGFDNKDVLATFKDMQGSNYNELRERAFEYAKNPNGIQNLTLIQDYDYNLAFLKPAIVKAVEQGLPKYDPSKLNVSLIISRPEPAAPIELPTQHREVKIDEQVKTTLNDTKPISDLKQLEGELEYKLAPKKVWIKKPGEETAPAAPAKVEPVSIPKPGNSSDPAKPITDSQQKIIDKREKVANKYFGGIEESNPLSNPKLSKDGATKKPTFLKPVAKPSTGEATNGSSSQQTDILGGGGVVSTPKQAASINLLDLDLMSGDAGSSLTPKPTATTGVTDLLGGDLLSGFDHTPKQTAVSPQHDTPKPSGGSKFVKPTLKTAQATVQKQLTPYPITEEEYEKYWNQFTIELGENVKSSNVRKQAEFIQLAKAVGFHITSTIDTDNICASKYTPGDKIVLFYGKYKVSGEVEVRLNGNDKEAVEFALESIKKYCAR